jgi:hypothetical protein
MIGWDGYLYRTGEFRTSVIDQDFLCLKKVEGGKGKWSSVQMDYNLKYTFLPSV